MSNSNLCHTRYALLSSTGKTHTMLGTDTNASQLGVMPSAISWLFRLINSEKDKTGARFSVRVSAVEVVGREEVLTDLLVGQAGGRSWGEEVGHGERK